MFETYNAAQYRALDDAAFEQRKSQIIELMSAEELPEGVTDEMLYAEADLIEADTERRNRSVALRNAKVNSVVAAAKPLEVNEPQKRASGFQVVSEENFIESKEYRTALAKHVLHQEKMPAEFIARVRQQRAAGDPVSVSFADGYTNVTDPTINATVTQNIPIPMTIADIQSVRRESGLILPLVRQTSFPGGVVFPISDLTFDFHWITDKQTSPFQYDSTPDVVSFTWHELEARYARTMLANALFSDNFKELLGPAFAHGYGTALDTAILSGNGTTQPLGILNDTRVVGYGTSGESGYVAPHALIVTASADDLADWTWWTSLLYRSGFNRLYRQDGTWLIGDATFGTYIETLKDDNNRPIATFDIRSDDAPTKIRGNRVVTLPNSLLGDFDSASAGDVVAVFGNLQNYAMNFQPNMPLTTTNWDDPESNTNKTRVLTAVDGKVIDNQGWVVIKKAAQG